MAPPRCNEELETTQEKFTSDKQYNKLARAVRRSIVCHDKLQTSQDEPQEEARRDAKDASKKTLDALDAFTRRPMTAANAPVKYLTTDDERHVARKLYADILAEMKRRAEDPSSKAMPLPSLAEFAGFDVPLEGDRGGKEEPRGCLPSKFTPVGEEDGKLYGCKH